MTSFSNSLSQLLRYLSLTLALLFLLPTPSFASDASLEFSPASVSVPTNSSFTTSILLDTAGYPTGGVGAIINFDPNMLHATKITPGELFADYPIASYNNNSGNISISGIVSSPDDLFNGTGLFATITFQPLYAGETQVTFVHEPGSTIDSNIAVTFGSGDVLNQVNTLQVTITPAGTVSNSSSSTSLLSSFKNLTLTGAKQELEQLLANLPFLRDKYASTRVGRPTSRSLEPYAPLVAQPPITDPSSSQPTAEVNNITTSSSLIPIVLITIILITTTLIVVVLVKNSRQ